LVKKMTKPFSIF